MTNEYETLAPAQFESQIDERIIELERAIKIKEAEIKKAPSGKIRIVKNKGHLQFYKIDQTSSRLGRYLPRSQNLLAYKLIQRDYDLKSLKALRQELKLLKTFRQQYNKKSVKKLEEKIPILRRSLITQITLPPDHYKKKWQSLKYIPKELPPQTNLATDNGEQVRSKSEVIIANALKSAGVPYRYEFPVTIDRSQTDPSHNKILRRPATTVTFHPDFYCLNLRTRREYIWEHFGLMDDPAYSASFAEKLQLYQANGYLPGRNLILTSESKLTPISTQVIKKTISEYLI